MLNKFFFSQEAGFVQHRNIDHSLFNIASGTPGYREPLTSQLVSSFALLLERNLLHDKDRERVADHFLEYVRALVNREHHANQQTGSVQMMDNVHVLKQYCIIAITLITATPCGSSPAWHNLDMHE